MPLQKQNLEINFAQGLETKSDPKQLQPGNFLELENSIFDKAKLLQKRYGYDKIGTIDSTYQSITTFHDNLIALGNNLSAFVGSTDSIVPKGVTTQLQLSTLPLIRSNSSQTQVDSQVSSDGVICTVFTDTVPSTAYKYVIADSETGQNIVAPVTLATPSEAPRVFLMNHTFIILWSESTNLNYIAIPTLNPSNPSAKTTLVTNYLAGSSAKAFDGIVSNNNLYVAYNGTDGAGAIRMTYLNSFLVRQTPATGVSIASTQACDILTVCADQTAASPVVWISFYKDSATSTYVMAVDPSLNIILAKTLVDDADTVLNLTAIAQHSQIFLFQECDNSYSWDSTIPSHYIGKIIVGQDGTLLDKRAFVYSLGLASKAFILESQPDGVAFTGTFDDSSNQIEVSSTEGLQVGQMIVDQTTPGSLDVQTQITSIQGNKLFTNLSTLAASAASPGDVLVTAKNFYFLGVYQSDYQSTYFLIDGISGEVIAKLAYSNAGGYVTLGLPSVSLINSFAYIPYLYKALITSVNKNTNVPAGNQVAGIYAQLGANLAIFDFTFQGMNSVQIGQNLNISGGIVRNFDGYTVSEMGFHLYPDLDLNSDGTYHGLSTATTGGSMTAQKYFYVATYEWQDNQGNLWRSAPSVPVLKDISSSMTSTNTITIKVPTLRVTAKTANPVKIVIYRWSEGQQAYYQVTSLTSPTLNSTTSDNISFTDTAADDTILGNALLYTTGGVVENIAPPAAKALSLFKSRFFYISAEDDNLLGYSKVVIEGTPVETSDLFTLYIAPTSGSQGSTGGGKCLAPMDDKLIITKSDALYYISGTGPDNTGSNNDFTDPVFITSTVGCANQNSIAFVPQGLMFQSNKGIWLLGRDLSTSYIGAPVEAYNSSTVLSASVVPGTNQVRFSLDTGEILVFDYFFGQWSVFKGIQNISSTIYEGKHTILDAYGRIFQQSDTSYLDGTTPSTIKFKTGWLNLAGVQGYQRAYFFYLIGDYKSPHKLKIDIAYDYNDSPSQTVYISPDNYNAPYGGDTIYGGGSPYGGATNLEDWRIFFDQQKCQAFQITVTEIFDASFGTVAGEGLTLSGMNIVVGLKSGYPRLAASREVG